MVTARGQNTASQPNKGDSKAKKELKYQEGNSNKGNIRE